MLEDPGGMRNLREVWSGAAERGAGRPAGVRSSRNNPSYFGRARAARHPSRRQRSAPHTLSANYSQSTDVLVVGLGL